MVPFTEAQTLALSMIEGSIDGIDYFEPFDGGVAVGLNNGTVLSVAEDGVVTDSDGAALDLMEF